MYIANEILMYFRNQKKSAQDVYISDPIDTDKDGNQLTLMDVVSCDDTILDDVDLKMKAEKLRRYIRDALGERERTIIELRYGICGTKPKTQREVAKLLGISRSYVSRIEKKALLDLKAMFEGEEASPRRLSLAAAHEPLPEAQRGTPKSVRKNAQKGPNLPAAAKAAPSESSIKKGQKPSVPRTAGNEKSPASKEP